MKEDKIIKGKATPIKIDKLTIVNNVGFEKSEPKFIKVDEFSGIVEEPAIPTTMFVKKEEAVISTPEAVPVDAVPVEAVPVEAVIEEPTEFYAEEVFDDEDDLYSEVIRDRALERSKFKTFQEMSNLVDAALLSRGISGKFGLDLLAAMNFSHLMRFENEPSTNFVDALFDVLGNPHYSFNVDEIGARNVAYFDKTFEIVSQAKENTDKPVFIYFKNLDPKNVMEFFRPVYYFIDNSLGENYLTGQGRSVSIPRNLYFLFSLKEGKKPFGISRRLLRYIANLPNEVVEIEKQENALTVDLSMNELFRSLNNAMNDFTITEDGWRKIDGLCDVIRDINGYTMHNKIVRRVEQFMTILLSSEIDENTALDIALARNVISEAIITNRPQDYVDEHDLNTALDSNFGSGNTPLTEKVVKTYLSLFDKGGNRIDE